MEQLHNTKETTAAAVGGKSNRVKKAKYTKILKDRGYRQYEPLEFYRELFPLGELAEYDPDPKHRNNENYEYISVIQERTNKTICYKDKRTNEFRTAKQSKRHVVCDDLCAIQRAIDTGNFVCMPPVSYIGKRRIDKNARFLHALVVEIDNLKTGRTKDQRDIGFKNLLHQFTTGTHICLPPSAIVCSGTGVHLYWFLAEPVKIVNHQLVDEDGTKGKYFGPMELNSLKEELTSKLWNPYITASYDSPQYQTITQCYRLVGSRGKKGQIVEAFEISGKRYTIEELYLQKGTACEGVIMDFSKYLLVKSQCDTSKHPKQYTKRQLECIEKYPVWAAENITHTVPKRKKGSWTFNRAVYDRFKERIRSGAVVGHRYYCLCCLATTARCCGITIDEVKSDFKELQMFLDFDVDNPFSYNDMLSALDCYFDDQHQYHTLDYIERMTGLTFERTKRNGRTQQMHLALLNENKKARKKLGDYFNEGGRPTAEAAVRQWRQDHPEGTKAQAYSDSTLGLSRPTIRKWWEG